jgi:hypothetical protein
MFNQMDPENSLHPFFTYLRQKLSDLVVGLIRMIE